jgi:hypothetical protein
MEKFEHLLRPGDCVCCEEMHSRVMVGTSEAWEELLGNIDNCLVDIHKTNMLDIAVSEYLTRNPSITPPNDENTFGMWHIVKGDMRDHLMVRGLIMVCKLQVTIDNKNIPKKRITVHVNSLELALHMR